MKKNKTMRVSAILLALVLITSCFVGGTFAKYTTSTTGSDGARVAYWGFNQAASTTIDLFDGSYKNISENETVKSSENDVNVVAPGTDKTATFAFGYTNYNTNKINAPEVAYEFNVDVDTAGSNTTNLDKNSNFKWTLKKGSEAGTEYSTLNELTNAIKALSGASSGTKQYAAGELPENFSTSEDVYTVGWKWAFDTQTGVGQPAAQDVTDTAMGNAQALENVSLKITITATQVD